MALTGNYESAGVYYQGVIQQIHRLLVSVDDPTRKARWQSVQTDIVSEYEQVNSTVVSALKAPSLHQVVRVQVEKLVS